MIPSYIVTTKPLKGDVVTRIIKDPEDVRRYIHLRMRDGDDIDVFAVIQVLKFSPGKQWVLDKLQRGQLEVLVRTQVQEPPAFK